MRDLKSAATEVHLCGPKPPPTWLGHVDASVRFIYRNDRKLFRKLHASTAPHRLDRPSPLERAERAGIHGDAIGPAALIERLGFAGIDLGPLEVGGRLAQFPGGPLPNQNRFRIG